VDSEEFAGTYAAAGDEDRAAAAALVLSGDRVGVEDWLRDRRSKDVSALSVKELRALAQGLGVRFYNQLPKALLLSEIANASKRPCEASA
jgi:hypothetical protein